MSVQRTQKVPFTRFRDISVQTNSEMQRNFEVVVEQSVPIGTVVPWAGQEAHGVPQGWLLCDGSAVLRLTYDSLFNVIGTEFGAGDGSTTFNLPNLSDRFPRGTHLGSEVGDTGGSAASVGAHSHSHSHGGATAPDGAFAVSHDAHTNNHGDNIQNHDHGNTSNQSANHAHGSNTNRGTSGTYGVVDSGTASSSGSWSTGGQDTDHVHTTFGQSVAHQHPAHATHSNHSVSSHTHVISADATSSGTATGNLPPFVDFRYIIKT